MPSDWLSCAGSDSSSQTQNTTQETTQQDTTQSSTAANGGKQQSWTSMIRLFGIMIVFVLIMIVPQKRREKKQKQMLDAVKAGDEVRTIGGIFGKVKMVKEDLVTITTGPNDDEMVFAKGAIEFVITPEDKAKMEELEKEAEEEDDDTKKKKSFFSRKK